MDLLNKYLLEKYSLFLYNQQHKSIDNQLQNSDKLLLILLIKFNIKKKWNKRERSLLYHTVFAWIRITVVNIDFAVSSRPSSFTKTLLKKLKKKCSHPIETFVNLKLIINTSISISNILGALSAIETCINATLALINFTSLTNKAFRTNTCVNS